MNKTQVRSAQLLLEENHATLCFYKDVNRSEKIMTVKSNKSAKVNNSDGQTVAEKEKHDGSPKELNQAKEKKP